MKKSIEKLNNMADMFFSEIQRFTEEFLSEKEDAQLVYNFEHLQEIIDLTINKCKIELGEIKNETIINRKEDVMKLIINLVESYNNFD